MPFCKSCGNEINPDKKICEMCGEPVIQEDGLSLSAPESGVSNLATLPPQPPPPSSSPPPPPPSSSYHPVPAVVKPEKPRSDVILLAGLGVIAIIAVVIYIGFPSIKMNDKDITEDASAYSPTPFTTWSVSGNAVSPISSLPVQTTPTQRTLYIPESSGLTTLITVIGQGGKTSDTFSVPGGYWELWYTADPLVTGGQDSHSATGSQSALFPSLQIQVIDKKNSDRVVASVEPPGGLDKTLWQKSGNDPRPWKQKFYEGNKEYYFVITARNLKSYAIEARIPKS